MLLRFTSFLAEDRVGKGRGNEIVQGFPCINANGTCRIELVAGEGSSEKQ